MKGWSFFGYHGNHVDTLVSIIIWSYLVVTSGDMKNMNPKVADLPAIFGDISVHFFFFLPHLRVNY